MMPVLQLRPSITVERHSTDSKSFTISDGSRSVKIGPQADMPLEKVLLTDILHERCRVEEFTKHASLRRFTLVAGEPDYEYCLRLLAGRYEERFCVAFRRADGGADYLCVMKSHYLAWVGDPLCDDIALFLSEADARLVVDGYADPAIEFHKRFMLKG